MVNAWHAIGFVAGASAGLVAEQKIAVPTFGLPPIVMQVGELAVGVGVAYFGLKMSGEVGSVVTGIGVGYGAGAVASAFNL